MGEWRRKYVNRRPKPSLSPMPSWIAWVSLATLVTSLCELRLSNHETSILSKEATYCSRIRFVCRSPCTVYTVVSCCGVCRGVGALVVQSYCNREASNL